MKKGLIIALVAVAIAILLIFVFVMNPGLPGRWEVASHKTTTTIGNAHIVNWDNSSNDWIELYKNGTGITSDGGEFDWEAEDGRITISGEFFGSTISTSYDYVLKGNELTVYFTGLLGIDHEITYHRA